ncbi:hypothetical protein ACFL0M_13295 [Thermodesulfobacteriota bacterium]
MKSGIYIYPNIPVFYHLSRPFALIPVAVMLRGHGAVVVAESVKSLLFASISLALNARNKVAAYQMGIEPCALREDELAE